MIVRRRKNDCNDFPQKSAAGRRAPDLAVVVEPR